MSNLRDTLLAIRDEVGSLTPGTVVAAATPKGSPLHHKFTWDDKVAGVQWRLEEARQLCRSVRVVYVEATETQPAILGRAFHSIETANGRAYEPVEAIVADEFSLQLIRQEAQREINALLRKWATFDEFAGLLKEALAS